mgnify:CR=1 FL=1
MPTATATATKAIHQENFRDHVLLLSFRCADTSDGAHDFSPLATKKIATGETRVLKVSELELWGDFAQGLLGLVLAGDSAGRLGDTLSALCALASARSTASVQH